MAFLQTGEDAAHRVAADVDFLAGFEGCDGDRAAEFQAVDAFDAVFAQMAERIAAGFGQVAPGRFVHEFFANFTETDLDSAVAVSGLALELGDAAGSRIDQGDRDGSALGVEELGHAQFLPKNADGHGRENNASWTAVAAIFSEKDGGADRIPEASIRTAGS